MRRMANRRLPRIRARAPRWPPARRSCRTSARRSTSRTRAARGLRPRHRRRSRGAKTVIRARDRARVSRSRHPRRGARLAEGNVELHVGDRPDRRHAQLHPRPDALGDADRAATTASASSPASPTSRTSASRSSRRRAASPNGGAAASGARCGRAAAARVADAVVACTDPEMFRTPGERAAFDRVADRGAAHALGRRLLRLLPARDGPDRHRDRVVAAGVRRAGADSDRRGRGRRRSPRGTASACDEGGGVVACGDRALHAKVLELLARSGAA